MMFARLGEGRLFVIASNAGAPRHPAWFHNVVAHPEVTVEMGAETFAAVASVPEGAERDRLFAELVEQLPFFADHQRHADGRVIPLVELRRAG